MAGDTLPLRLSDLPLWRLLVALDDAERATGPTSPTTRVLARAVQKRLGQERPDKSVRHATPGQGPEG
jgi:hypothetical protein